MGNTYRGSCYTYLRRPRGKKQALINNVRTRAVPPDDWDDIRPCRLCGCYKLAVRMKQKGFTQEVTVRKIVRKCPKLSHRIIEDSVKSAWEYN